MKKFLLFLLAVAIAAVAFTVQADNYGINVAGVEVSTSNYNSVTGGDIKFYTPSGGTQSSPYSGYSYVQYNSSSKVLTLANVYISRTGGDNYGVHNRSVAGLTIKFVGTCRVESNLANAIHMDKNTYVEFASGSSVVCKMSAGTNDRRGVIYANDGVQARFRGPGSLEVYGNTKSGNSAKTDGFEGKGKSNSCSLYFESDVNVYVNVSGYGIDKFGTVNVDDCDLRIAHSNINFPLYDVNSFGYSSGAKCVTPCEASFSSSSGYFYNASGYTHFTENYGVILYPSWFPDDNFRNYLLGKCTSGEEYLTPSQLQGLTSIDVSSKSISSLNGVEYLTYLTSLNCSYNNLTSLYVLPLTRLQTLRCNNNRLQYSFDLPSSLQTIYCGGNLFTSWGVSGHSAIKTIDVSNCTSLTTLSCDNNSALTSLSVSGCTALTTISIDNDKFTSLPSLPSSLETLSCRGNQLTSLGTLPTSLKYLLCGGNKFTTLSITGRTNLKQLDVSNTTTLTTLNCYNNALNSLNVSGCSSMTSLNCSGNMLSSLSNLPSSLQSLYCQSNYLTSLPTLPSSLQTLNCSSNRLSGSLNITGRSALKTLNVSSNTSLTTLYCYSNALTSLDVSGCTSMTSLYCSSNQLTSLGTLPSTLQTIDCSSNRLSGTHSIISRSALKTLNVSNNTSLTTLNCHDNALTSLNVSGCSSMTSLNCSYNQLTSLGTLPSSLQTIDCYSNRLSGTLSITGRSALQTLNVGSNTGLTTLNCHDNALTSLNVGGCTALTKLDCYNNQLTSLSIGALPSSLQTIDCSYNQLTMLNLDGCSALRELCASNNQLTTLDLDGCSALRELYASNNTRLNTLRSVNGALTTLAVNGCTGLTSIYCYGNQLTLLEMTDCTALVQLYCYNNHLTSLPTLPSTLQELLCGSNEFTTLYVTGLGALRMLDVSNNASMTTLHCNNNALTYLNLGGCSAVTEIYCNNNQLTSLNVDDCTALTRLLCNGNRLTELSVQNCSALNLLNIRNNQINSTEMGNLVNSLRTIPQGSEGKFIVYQADNASTEGNAITAAQIAIATSKRWNLKMMQGGTQVDIVPNETSGLLGDVDDSGKVDVTDVNIVVNIMLGKAQASDYPGNADVNNSGKVDVSDVNKIVNIMLGKE